MNVKANTTTTDFQAYLMPSTTGLPTPTGTIPAALLALLQNADGTEQFFAQQYFVANLINDVNSGAIDWIADTDDNGNSMYFAAVQDNSGNTMYLTLTSSQPPPSNSDLPQYTAPDGNTYDVIGSFHATLSWNNNTVWAVTVPVGVISGTGSMILTYYAWDSFMKPMLQGLLSGIKTLCSYAPGCSSAADVSAASGAAEDGAEVADASIGEGATISMTAGVFCFGGAALLIALPFILSAVEHPTGHDVKVYNLTPYTLTWQQPYTDDCTMTQFPVASDGSNDPDYVISGPTVIAPPGGQSITTYHEGDFAFQNTNNLKGISWAMQFALTDAQNNQQAAFAVMFDLPLLSANSLAGEGISTLMSSDDLQAWAKDNYGALSQKKLVVDGPNDLVMTLTYNAVSGKQPLPGDSDEEGYVYSSVIVFQQLSS